MALYMYIGAMNMDVHEAAKHATTKSLLCADKDSTLEILYIHVCVHTKAWE